MSYNEYLVGRKLDAKEPPFYALIQAAMLRADTKNTAKLRAAWPEVWDELNTRCGSRGGYLPEEIGR